MSDLELLHNQEEIINEDNELVISEESAEIISDILSENDKAQSVEEIEEIKDKLYSYDNLPNALVHLVEGYLDYSKEVILERALPNIDGFKPSQRRILYAMKYLERDNDLMILINALDCYIEDSGAEYSSHFSVLNEMIKNGRCKDE